MAIETVLFARCDRCGNRWEVQPGYRSRPMAWGGPLVEIDLCQECSDRITPILQPLLDVARSTAPVRRSHSAKPGTHACICGRDFGRKMGLTRHVSSQGDRDNHRPVEPD